MVSQLIDLKSMCFKNII